MWEDNVASDDDANKYFDAFIVFVYLVGFSIDRCRLGDVDGCVTKLWNIHDVFVVVVVVVVVTSFVEE
jgi:hypothetical protein